MSGAVELLPAPTARLETRAADVSFVAIKTATVRNEYGKEETVTAGVTHVHDVRHFLVTEYPHLFAREGTARAKASGRTRSRTASPTAPRKPLALPRKPLIRFSESRSAVRIELRADAYRQMGDHAYGPGSDVETGGGLFGYAYLPKTNTIVIREALGPGPASRARHGGVLIDRDHIDRQAEQYKRDGVDKTVVGVWHSHPTPGGDQPSDSDLLAFAGAMQYRGVEHYIGLILTPMWERDSHTYESYPSWAKPTVHAWHMRAVAEDEFICTRAEVVRC